MLNNAIKDTRSKIANIDSPIDQHVKRNNKGYMGIVVAIKK